MFTSVSKLMPVAPLVRRGVVIFVLWEVKEGEGEEGVSSREHSIAEFVALF